LRHLSGDIKLLDKLKSLAVTTLHSAVHLIALRDLQQELLDSLLQENIDKTYMVDAPESRENVIDMFGVPNVLEKDTIEHNDITSIKVIYNTILDPGEMPQRIR
jgi:hypothetical protein